MTCGTWAPTTVKEDVVWEYTLLLSLGACSTSCMFTESFE